MHSKAVVALLALLLAAAALPAGAAASSDVRLATQSAEKGEELQVRPATVSFTGDGTGYLGGRITSPGHYDRGGIDWLSWGERVHDRRVLERAGGYWFWGI